MDDITTTAKLITLIDDQALPYIAFNALNISKKAARPINASQVPHNLCTFLSETLPVARFATGVFSTDLTSRDDVILAISSLLLILAIEGILTTILVRTCDGNVSNFGFSIKQFLELAREFRWRGLVYGRRSESHPRKSRVKPRLLFIATLILLFTFGLEVLVLVLSSPPLVDVYNTDSALQLLDAVNPDWNHVNRNVGAAINRPCTAITMVGVEQAQHQINPCLTVNGSTIASGSFQTVTTEVDLNFTTVVHEFGTDHFITIGEDSLAYLSRCYFRLGDNKNRIMGMRRRVYNDEIRIGFVHKQYVAYLFNRYARETGDQSMNIQRLDALDFQFKSQIGPNVKIIQINKRSRFREVTSTMHTTTVRGVIPRGSPALQFAQAVLKAAAAVSVNGPDQYDLQMGSGNTAGEVALIWRESSRTLNWLSLNILLAAAVAVFFIMRLIFKPVGTAEIAEIYALVAVGASSGRPPGYMAKDEKEYFSLPREDHDLEVHEEYSDITSHPSAQS